MEVADRAWSNIMRLTAPLPGGRKQNEKLKYYVARARSMQDKELERYDYALYELLKLGKHYEEYK